MINYCTNKAAAEGFDLYYAMLFETATAKNISVCLHALSVELAEVIAECSDPGIARIKFKWWQEEIERLFNREARHPITQAISKNIPLDKLNKHELINSVDNFERFLILEQTQTLEQSLSYFNLSVGTIWHQYGALANINEQAVLDLIRTTGALYYYLSCLQQPRLYITESRCIIPTDYLTSTTIADISNNEIEQTTLFSSLILDVKRQFDELYVQFPKKTRRSIRHILILNRLASTLCGEIVTNGCQLLSKNTRLTPIRKLWIAWRSNIGLSYF